MRKTKIKICGITTAEEMKWLIEEKVEYAGIVLFFTQSKRYCTQSQAENILKMARELSDPDQITLVAVCVCPTEEQIALVAEMGFDMIQIHGSIDAEVLKNCRIPVIRAYPHQQYQEGIWCQEPNIAGILLDAARPGSGEVFEWGALDQKRIEQIRDTGRLFFLAGGLNCDNVRAAIDCIAPDVVDCSSGVEIEGSKGKDREKIKNFVREVRRYE